MILKSGFNVTEISIISKVIYKSNIIQAKMTTFFKKNRQDYLKKPMEKINK